MLRSLDSGVSGLQAQQTMLDVVSNNIANVNTTGYKANSVEFEDTLSQMLGEASAPGTNTGGTNPSEVGLGVRVASIDTNFTEGAAENTGVDTNMMINGDGFFVVNVGGQTEYTRAGDFTLDGSGNLVSPDGGIVQGWSATNGVVNTGETPGNLTLPMSAISPAVASTGATVTGNLPSDAAAGTAINSEISVYDASGNESDLSLTFTAAGGGAWNVTATGPGGSTGTDALTFSNGAITGGQTMTVGGITVDLSQVTGFAGNSSANLSAQNGRLVLERDEGGHRSRRARQLREPVGSGERRQLELRDDRELRRCAAGNSRVGQPRHDHLRRAGRFERGPLAGVHQPDRGPARIPGFGARHHDVGRRAPGTDQPEAELGLGGGGGGGLGRARPLAVPLRPNPFAAALRGAHPRRRSAAPIRGGHPRHPSAAPLRHSPLQLRSTASPPQIAAGAAPRRPAHR
jgi:flagellar hook-basal body protein